jgi:hypothetical protein
MCFLKCHLSGDKKWDLGVRHATFNPLWEGLFFKIVFVLIVYFQFVMLFYCLWFMTGRLLLFISAFVDTFHLSSSSSNLSKGNQRSEIECQSTVTLMIYYLVINNNFIHLFGF